MAQLGTTKTRWTKEEDDFLRHHAGKITFKEISRRIGRDPSSADARARRLGIQGMPKGIARKQVARQLTRPPRGWCPRRASILHLVDLKRAGHSSRQTEMTIRGDGAVSMPLQPSAIFSSLGSPAAMCAIE